MSKTVNYKGFRITAFEYKMYITDTNKNPEETYVIYRDSIICSLLSINESKEGLDVTPQKRVFEQYTESSPTNNSQSVITQQLDDNNIPKAYENLIEVTEDTAERLSDDDYGKNNFDSSGKTWATIVKEYVIGNEYINIDEMIDIVKMFIDWNMVPCNDRHAFFEIGDWKKSHEKSNLYDQFRDNKLLTPVVKK